MKLLRKRSENEATPNLAPLVDVVLVTLLFVVVSARFEESGEGEVRKSSLGIEVQTPVVPTASGPGVSGQVLIITIEAGGNCFVGDQSTSEESLLGQLRQRRQATPGLKCLVRADRAARVDKLARVIDICREAGVRTRLEVQKERKQ